MLDLWQVSLHEKFSIAVGLRGPGPGLDFSRGQQNPPNIGPSGNDMLAQTKVSAGGVWGFFGTRFLHPEEDFNVVALNRLIMDACINRSNTSQIIREYFNTVVKYTLSRSIHLT